MPNIKLDKSVNILTNKTIKLSSFIAYMFRKNLLHRLPRKYCFQTKLNLSNIIISDYNCKLFEKNKAYYGNMSDSYNLRETLLKDTYTYHGSLKKFIKAASYSQILFHKKCKINESIVELDVNSFYAYAMINIEIIKGKPKVMSQNINLKDITFIAEVKIEYLKEKHWSNKLK
jgi:hypothetical protein